jgi:hypothetical protein
MRYEKDAIFLFISHNASRITHNVLLAFLVWVIGSLEFGACLVLGACDLEF